MMNLSSMTILFIVAFSATISAFSVNNVVGPHISLVSPSSPTVLYATVADKATATKITTGPDGKAAMNSDEDLLLTLQIIMDHQRRSSTVSTEQLVQQVTAAAAIIDDDSVIVDISIPYDAAARLAFDHESASVKTATTFESYKIQYEAKAVADVIAKKDKTKSPAAASTATTTKDAVDISIPYDAAAQLAFAALSAEERNKMTYSTFQQHYIEKAVADVIAKKTKKDLSTPPPAAAAVAPVSTSTTNHDADVDVSIPYDSAAQLAYTKLHSIKHSLTYEQFKTQYERNAVLNVVAKKLKREQQLSV